MWQKTKATVARGTAGIRAHIKRVGPIGDMPRAVAGIVGSATLSGAGTAAGFTETATALGLFAILPWSLGTVYELAAQGGALDKISPQANGFEPSKFGRAVATYGPTGAAVVGGGGILAGSAAVGGIGPANLWASGAAALGAYGLVKVGQAASRALQRTADTVGPPSYGVKRYFSHRLPPEAPEKKHHKK